MELLRETRKDSPGTMDFQKDSIVAIAGISLYPRHLGMTNSRQHQISWFDPGMKTQISDIIPFWLKDYAKIMASGQGWFNTSNSIALTAEDERKQVLLRKALGTVSKANEKDMRGDKLGAIDSIYEHFNELLLSGQFEVVNMTFAQLDYDALETDVILSLLSITRPATEDLRKRRVAYAAAERLIRERNEPEADLLVGL